MTKMDGTALMRSTIHQGILKGSTAAKLNILGHIIYEEARGRFGEMAQKYTAPRRAGRWDRARSSGWSRSDFFCNNHLRRGKRPPDRIEPYQKWASPFEAS